MTMEQKTLEQIEDEIADLASRVAAASARLLDLLAELHRRERWAEGFTSIAHWMSWRTGLDLVAAREHVRVAVALEALPATKTAFARGEVSYSKVRAITRIARPGTEALLLYMARHASASQLEKIVRGVRRVHDLDERQRVERMEDRRRCDADFDEDGMLVVRARLAPEEGALFLRALEDAKRETGQDRAGALALMADRSLSPGACARRGGDRVQVVVHVDADVLADPTADGQSQLADGPGVSAETSRRLACDASLVTMVDGQQVGRKTRVWSAALRRALDLRDGATCRFPGCTHRIVDAHHIVHWTHGGPTTLENACLLCRYHHTKVHEGGFRVERDGAGLRFFDPRGREIATSPPLAARAPLEPASGAWALAPIDYTPNPDYGWAVEDVLLAEVEASV